MNRFLVVDDEDKARAVLHKLLQLVEPYCQVTEANSAEQGITRYLEFQPDLIFLDIEMPHKNGFELVQELILSGESPRVVFITAFNQYAIQAIKASALDYLLKPINENDLKQCINRAKLIDNNKKDKNKLDDLINRLNMNNRLKVNTRTGFEIIKQDNILYCEADGNYTNICLTNRTKLTTATTLGIIEDQLISDLFFRVSRSILINLDYLKSVNRKDKVCHLQIGGECITLPLSCSRVQKLAEIF
ncbi:DNA-binding response regulator [Ancylomarina euxinus]|uniref:DNA-binding response regulator n=1 Tax=Ancylomarina euxinus TaxID=2283627 RepID=A0A425Y7W5_9BACT|nr:LytTR family DNA-binding domain-containing protein [Ancylomarina euxinus]MCZ4693524.1 LytTR family DNA-binding domain-containing protein [Ancylomarina euxinus]MUP13751.1 response regulator [Ancylomarina euxinus]RRG24611.1 DNA-binding response regulator [Ancylomarina euxinus]